MADSPSLALVKRPANDVSLMPPPPFKRIKRPTTVLEEDEYTAALSEIIARDYFPGLYEVEAQHEYLAALDSGDEKWIAEAGKKLREAAAPRPSKRRQARNTRFNDVDLATPRRPAGTWSAETPIGHTGDETPIPATPSVADETTTQQQHKGPDTAKLSLGAFQAKYTSEDNESFNSVLDKHNEKRRIKNAHLWTQDQRILSARQIAHRTREANLIKQKAEDEAAGKSLVPITSGATDLRPAKPDAWNIKRPDNTFMFNAGSVDEDGLQTVQEVKEQTSKAGPKQVVYSNTRFPPLQYLEDPGMVPPSPSLNTDIVARRDAEKSRLGQSAMEDYDGGETPRVNGYAFVDEDEPENIPIVEEPKPSYRDLLAGQAGDGTMNPFKINDIRKREDLHLRLVEKQAKKIREKERDTMKRATPSFGGASTPGYLKTPADAAGNMTPAARRLMEKLGGQTPSRNRGDGSDGLGGKDKWTPSQTPRRRHVAK